MAGFSTGNNEHLIRSQIWSTQLKEVLEDELFAMKYVDMLEGFPDGDTFNIPSIGQAEVRDYDEGQAIQYTAMDTGNFTFTITEYKSSATYIYNKFKQDTFYMNQLVSSFVPKMQRALMKAFGEGAAGIFTSPTAVEDDVLTKYGVKVIGRAEEVTESYYAISAERRIKHPAVSAITAAARKELFR